MLALPWPASRLAAASWRRPSAQRDYPNQLVPIVVPFSAGSITDGLARILADKLSHRCGSSRSSWRTARVSPGTTGVAKAAPDGYTLMLTSNGHTIAGAINKGIQSIR